MNNQTEIVHPVDMRFFRILLATSLFVFVGTSAALANPPQKSILDGGEPTLAHKIWLYHAQRTAPDVIVAGSSRILRINPAVIQSQSGHSAFNFGISDASAYEAWQAYRYSIARNPTHVPHLVLGIEPDSFNDRRTPRRSGIIAGQLVRKQSPIAIANYARRTIRPMGARRIMRPDGSVRRDIFENMFARGVTLQQRLDQTTYKLLHPGTYRRGWFDHLYPRPKSHLDSLLALANAHGDQPVIFISPIQPQGWRTLGRRGLSHRRTEMLTYLDQLHARRDFRVIDLAFVGSFGGDPNGFFDWQHMNNVNAWRVVAELQRQGAWDNRAGI